MIYSMTAFARQEAQTELGTFVWEMRAVNHRYLEISLRLPEMLRNLEGSVREEIGSKLSRGKIEANLFYQPNNIEGQIQVNQQIVQQVLAAAAEVNEIAHGIQPLRAIDILRWQGVIESKSIDSQILAEKVLSVLTECLNDLIANRAREGKLLQGFLRSRLQSMQQQLELIQTRIPTVTQQVHKKLWQRYETLKIECDTTRLEQELALQLQKMDVSEEVDRLHAHIREVERVLAQGGVAGRRLDFLLQELNREANTLGAKALDPELANYTVELKVLIDQMREQVQNIE